MTDTGRPIADAPRAWGHRIQVLAELGSSRPENAFNGWVSVHWDAEAANCRLSPYVEDTHIDSPVTVWRPLPPAIT